MFFLRPKRLGRVEVDGREIVVTRLFMPPGGLVPLSFVLFFSWDRLGSMDFFPLAN